MMFQNKYKHVNGFIKLYSCLLQAQMAKSRSRSGSPKKEEPVADGTVSPGEKTSEYDSQKLGADLNHIG